MSSQLDIIGCPAPCTWEEWEQHAIAVFGGGYHEREKLEIFQHGMRTVFNWLKDEMAHIKLKVEADHE